MVPSEFTEILVSSSCVEQGLGLPERGARLPSFLGLPAGLDLHALLELLAACVVVILGTGSVGACIALHLARLGIGELRLVDRGSFKKVSLRTQPILPASVGMPKASTVGRDCKSISPASRVLAFDGDLEALSLAALADVNMAFIATDNLRAEVVAGDRFAKLGVPLVQASVHGGSLVAQVRFFSNAAASGPCPSCGFGPAEMALLQEESSFSCEGSSSLPGVRSAPTMSVSPLCSLAADLAVLQALKHLFRLGSPPADSVLEFCAHSGKSAISPLRRNPGCPCEHIRFERRPLPRQLDACSPSQLMAACGLPGQDVPAGVSLAVDGLVFVESGACNCSASVPVQRFAAPGARPLGSCPRCGSGISPSPFFTRSSLGGSLLSAMADRPLGLLGVPASAAAAVIRFPDSRAVLLASAQEKEPA